MAPPSTVVETTCSAATRPVTVAGSIFNGDCQCLYNIERGTFLTCLIDRPEPEP